MPGAVRTLRQTVAWGFAVMISATAALAQTPSEGGKTPILTDTAPPPVQSPPLDEQNVAPSGSAPPVSKNPAPTDEETYAPKKLAPVAPSEATAILGRKVKGTDGKDIVGAIVDILVDGQGKPRAALIDFGGYMGVGSRKVAVDWSLLTFRPNDPETPVILALDRAELQAAPEYKDPTRPAEVVEAPPAAATPAATVPAGTVPAPDNVEPRPN